MNTYELMYTKRACFPNVVARSSHDEIVAEIERIAHALKGDIVVDVMTDQIDVLQNSRRIATYMPCD